MIYKVDINCDVGEGVNNESELMPYITSCNIACCAHAGTISTIDKTIKIAQKYQVKIGAHPSFPDRENFGRKVLKIPPDELQKSIENQLNLLKERVNILDAKLHHIKAHGALYILSTTDETTAKVLVKAIKNTTNNVFLYVPQNSVIERIAIKNDIKVKYEAFVDRNYNDDLTLVSRSENNALITAENDAFEHIYDMIIKQKVKTISGLEVDIKADTFCVHGDNVNAIKLVKFILESLQEKGIQVGSWKPTTNS